MQAGAVAVDPTRSIGCRNAAPCWKCFATCNISLSSLFLSACVAVRFPPTTTNRCCILSCTISGNKLVFLSSFNMFPSTSCMYNPVYAQQTTSKDNGFPQWISKELHRYQIVINVEVSRIQWQRKSCRQDLDVQAFYYRPF